MLTEEKLDELIKQTDVYYKQVICFIGIKAEKEFSQLTNKEEQNKWLKNNYLKKWFWTSMKVEKGYDNMKIKVTEDKELANQIRAALRKNSGYCPCKLIKNEDTKCMCKEFREQGVGECHCGLYIKTEE